jgi:hypothetical protein
VIYTRPFITGRFIAYGGSAYDGDSWSRELFLAVAVLDSFTEEVPQAAIRVRLKELPRSIPVRNRSGFFCFEGIPTPGPYTLTVEPNRTTSDWYYLEPTGPVWNDTFERTITLPKPDPKSPVETAIFVPKSSYPFPSNATLVRGKVTHGSPAGVEGAIVSTSYLRVPSTPPNVPPGPPAPLEVKTLTDREGEFVLFFKRLSTETQLITLEAEKDGEQFSQAVMITEGTTLKNIQLDLPL